MKQQQINIAYLNLYHLFNKVTSVNMLLTSSLKENERAKVVYIIHGYTGNGEYWSPSMKDSFLNRYGNDAIIIGIVKWEYAASRDKRARSMSIARNPAIPEQKKGINTLCCGLEHTLGEIGQLGDDYIVHGDTYLRASINLWPVGNILGYVNQAISHNYDKTFQSFCVGFIEF